MRVYEFAKEHDLQAKELLKILKEGGFSLGSHMAVLDKEALAFLEAKFKKKESTNSEIKKTIKAVKDFNAKSLILGGGVSANQELRKQFKNKLEKESPETGLFFPKPDLSTDNALMTAITGFYHQKETKDWQKIEADGNLRIGE